ncbi:hypothetical protein JFV29_12415 [Peribacillus sp. TH16]|uniref:hypothetical protein n=1 Tax=Peribacillus sp. TH16 TaxID=2798482 RepID=UPI001913F6A2|nr:hypothetical protein [Peribacillus sp. TH16]MBK5482686.1 hypothetical protein [Peribacillus sp. TH16]
MKRVSEVQREYIIRFAMIEDLDINVTAEIVGMNPRTLKDWVRKEKKRQVQDTPSEHPSVIPLEPSYSSLERKINRLARLSKIRRR